MGCGAHQYTRLPIGKTNAYVLMAFIFYFILRNKNLVTLQCLSTYL